MFCDTQRNENDNTVLSHYTTYENLIYILKSRKIRLSEISTLNDKTEEIINGCLHGEKRYVFCMTYSQSESVAMWSLYGKASGIKIKISFPQGALAKGITEFYPKDTNEESIPHKCFVKDNNRNKLFSIRDMTYYDKSNKRILYKGAKIENLELQQDQCRIFSGYVKYNAWEFEKEVRLSAVLNGSFERCEGELASQKYIFANISDELISKITVTHNPWISDDVKQELERSINDLAKKELKHENSTCNGEIADYFNQ